MDNDTHAAEQGKAGRLLDGKVAGAVQCRPDELRLHRSILASEFHRGAPTGSDTALADWTGKDSPAVARLPSGAADETARIDVGGLVEPIFRGFGFRQCRRFGHGNRELGSFRHRQLVITGK